ncbi:MAG: hypothetical protein GX786_03330 [Clostridiales bacterium]|nr:hypothetical protein [Clostridiales bacterium]
MNKKLFPFSNGSVTILPEKTYFLQTTYQASGNLTQRVKAIRDYMLSLSSENLLRNFLSEAGLWNENGLPDNIFWGWESPTSQLRGHFLGHWLSAAAQFYAQTGDMELKGKADAIIESLAQCQKRNGGQWVFSIPEKYLDLIGRGEIVWAPQYTLHKTLMGLWDMYAYANNNKALEILKSAADWFYQWSGTFTKEEFDKVLDFETGGMLEIWADLYGETGDEKHLALLNRYWRSNVFEPLVKGEDVLTNYHANTTIPEVLGALRAFETTGEKKWLDVVQSYWTLAVTKRGYYATGGQTNGEAWTPPQKLSARLGKHNQEHCTVYNMMRLAHWLYTYTGDIAYADYWERNFYNGLLAQEHPQTGMVAYYLPMEAGNKKHWGHPTNDFWCCHGSLVQAPCLIPPSIYFIEEEGIRVSQYLPSQGSCQINDVTINIRQIYAVDPLPHDRQNSQKMKLEISVSEKSTFPISFRCPWWVVGSPSVTINGIATPVTVQEGLFTIEKEWENDELLIVFEKEITAVPLPDDPHMIAFMEGPIVLAGLCSEETTLFLQGKEKENLLIPHNELSCECWRNEYKTQGQRRNIRFLPLHTITDEAYAIYFPIA